MRTPLLSALAAALISCAAASLPAAAADFYAVVPVSGAGRSTLEPVTLAISSTTLPQAWVDYPYAVDLSPTVTIDGEHDADAAKVRWRLVSGHLPQGVSLSQEGLLAGVPTAENPRDPSIVLEASYQGRSSTRQIFPNILATRLTLGALSTELPSAQVGKLYVYDLMSIAVVSGPTEVDPSEVRWRLSRGTLPEGIALSDKGVLSGTPIQASDQAQTFDLEMKLRSTTQVLTFSMEAIRPQLTLSLASATPPTGEVGRGYTADMRGLLIGKEGTTPVDVQSASWAVVSGALPSGLSLSSNGVISGTPSKAVSQTVTLEAKFDGEAVQATYSFSVPGITYGGFIKYQIWFSRGTNGGCFKNWYESTNVRGITASDISLCYVDSGGYRYRPYGGSQFSDRDSVATYYYYAVQRQPYQAGNLPVVK